METEISKKYQLAVNELYRAKDFFLNRFCDEERVKNAKVFITIQTSARKNNLGHFWADRWDGDTTKEGEEKNKGEVNRLLEPIQRRRLMSSGTHLAVLRIRQLITKTRCTRLKRGSAVKGRKLFESYLLDSPPHVSICK